MSVTERFEDPGQFDVEFDNTLGDITEVLEQVVEMGHIVITPQWVPHPEDYTEANFLAQARYTGVVLETEWGSDELRVRGAGLVWHLGDQEAGPILFERLTFNSGTLSQFLDSKATNDGLLPPGISQGTITTTGVGTLTIEFEPDTFPIEGIRTVMEALNCHFRVNPDFTIDSCLATRDDVYQVTTPAAIVVRDGFGSDPRYEGIEPDKLLTRRDAWKWISRAIIVDEQFDGTRTIPAFKNRATNNYFDGNNNQLVRNARFSRPASDDIDVDTYLQRQLDQWDAFDEQELDLTDYIQEGNYRVGDFVGVFDPPSGFVDTTNEVQFRGQTIWPLLKRITLDEWDILPDMGVYYRPGGAAITTADYIDLTRYVKAGT